MKIKHPVQWKVCESSTHYTDLIIWGECNSCKKVWGLSDASNEYPEFVNKGRIITEKEAEMPF